MTQKDFSQKINSQLLEEISDNSAVGAGWGWGWARLSPISNALGNKGAVCTGTIECQNNCR